jgi:hypothetical protein
MTPQDVLNSLRTVPQADAIQFMNEFISFLVSEQNFGSITTTEYTVEDNEANPMTQDAPKDYKSLVEWSPNKNIVYHANGTFTFPAIGTYTLTYIKKPTLITTSNLDKIIPVDVKYHVYFYDYVLGKYHMNMGEGDEETTYGTGLVETAKAKALQVGIFDSNWTQGPVLVHNPFKLSRRKHINYMESDDDE